MSSPTSTHRSLTGPRRRMLALASAAALGGIGLLIAAGPAQAAATIQITGPSSPVPVNTPYTYTITDTPPDAFITSITADLSGAAASITAVSATTSAPGGVTCSITTGTHVACTIPSGATAFNPVTVTLTVLPTAAGTVTVSAADTNVVPSLNGSGSTTTTIGVPPFPFTGFFSPVDNPPTINEVHAGQAIPIKFSLGSDQGLNILAAGYPSVQQVSCATGAPINSATETDTAGNSGLQDNGDGTYTYVWKTSKASAGTCQVFTLGLTDGTFHTADFQYAG